MKAAAASNCLSQTNGQALSPTADSSINKTSQYTGTAFGLFLQLLTVTMVSIEQNW